jgi:hypothetical protein
MGASSDPTASKPLVRHMFDTHNQPPYSTQRCFPIAPGPQAASVAVSVRWRASPRHQSSEGRWQRKFFQCYDRCCTRKYAAQSLVRPARFEPIPSCVCRWDTSVVQQWNVSYAYLHPSAPPRERAAREYVPAAHRAQNRFKNRNGYSAPVP